MSGRLEFSLVDGVDRIRINHPETKNALTQAMCAEFARHLREIRDDPAIRVVVIEGEGKDFCSGADIGDIAEISQGTPEKRAAHVDKSIREISQAIFIPLAELRQPLIVGARGWAVGAGFEFCACADLVVASDTARFLMPLVNLAHTADHGESYFLPRKVGMSRAMQIALLGEPLSAVDAERFGLVNWVVADTALEAKVDELARKLATGARVAVEGMKALMRDSDHHTLREQFERERVQAMQCVASDDFVEAINAFRERRKPAFKGK